MSDLATLPALPEAPAPTSSQETPRKRIGRKTSIVDGDDVPGDDQQHEEENDDVAANNQSLGSGMHILLFPILL